MQKPKTLESWILEARLTRSLGRIPCRTKEQALRWVAFGLRCLRETPCRSGQACEGLVTDPFLRKAVETVSDWLDGRGSSRQLQEAGSLARGAAFDLAGNQLRRAEGANAAVWCAAYIIQAAADADRIGELPEGMIQVFEAGEDAAENVATELILAASFARRAADDEHEQAAIHFQAQLVGELWPGGQEAR